MTRPNALGKLNRGKRACAFFVLCAATAIAQPEGNFTTLVPFNGSDGASPEYVSLVQGADGEFYGTTSQGGTNNFGTIFKLTARGTLTTLHSFDGADGEYPFAGLVLATDGEFYGTTSQGGANGYGTIFTITSWGKLVTLYSFDLIDGADPDSLVQAANGDFYGTTRSGGANGYGTVFKMTSSGTLTTLHSFHLSDGAQPYAPLIQATDGNFYGTTYSGGANGSYGTVFKITSRGALTVLHSFAGTDGRFPYAGLLQAADGDLYGTTYAGGLTSCNGGCGTIFKITLGGIFATLHSFAVTDGENPSAGLIQATDGNLYGTTTNIIGGSNGTIFSIMPAGTLTTLKDFYGYDGSVPYGGLLQGTDADFYGTTYSGGTSGYGTVFSLSAGLGPFVRTVPASGKVGTAVEVLGTDLAGADSVTFNGASATFTVVSPSEISAIVPTDATTGKVRVAWHTGALLSNVPFRVLP